MAQDKKGFSRRHETNEAHVARQNARRDKKRGQLDAAQDRVEMAEVRKPSLQLKRLNSRLGKGVGAKKERAKLEARIAKGDKSRATLEEEAEKKNKKVPVEDIPVS
jgi:hypothetical protein